MYTESSPETKTRLDTLWRDFLFWSSHLAGYPCNQDFDYSELLPFLRFAANNVGDPFHDSNFRVNTHEMERELIARFAALTRIEQTEAWGYVTTGGTEGNMYGLYMGRELYPDGVAYFSQDTHYSVLKLLRVLNMRQIMIKSTPDGEIDYDDFRETVRIYRDSPVIFMANIGTTMKGAIDDLGRVHAVLDDLAVTQRYVHADAALSGMILPFVENPQPFGFDAGIDSISISGHKLVGSPIPCGVVLTKQAYVSRIARAVEYVGVLDTTIPGSRNAFTPLVLWYAFQQHGEDGFRRIVAQAMEIAQYAVDRFQSHGIPAWRHRNSLTVVFPRPAEDVWRKWQIAPYGNIAHIITMPQVTRETVDEIIADCVRGSAS